jgi:hypothetical protein
MDGESNQWLGMRLKTQFAIEEVMNVSAEPIIDCADS